MESPHYLYYDGARVSSESNLGKELMKWERKPDWTPERNQLPRMLYRAHHRPDGRRSVGEVQDSLFPVQTEKGPVVQPGAAEQWSRRCQLTVYNETELQRAMEAGWRKHPQEALDHLQGQDNAVGNLTAERHYADARMSPQAQAEAATVDQTTLKHIPSVPESHVQPRRAASPEVRQKRIDSLAKARAAKAAKANPEPAV